MSNVTAGKHSVWKMYMKTWLVMVTTTKAYKERHRETAIYKITLYIQMAWPVWNFKFPSLEWWFFKWNQFCKIRPRTFNTSFFFLFVCFLRWQKPPFGLSYYINVSFSFIIINIINWGWKLFKIYISLHTFPQNIDIKCT